MGNVIPLDQAAIKALLGKPERQIAPQNGPIRWFDVEMRCASRGCSSPTYIKLQGIPKCSMHTLREVNEMVIKLGVVA